MAISKESEEFLSWLVVERGRSHNTIMGYRRDLLSYESFLASQSVAVGQASQLDIEKYIQQLKAAGRKPSAVARPLAAIRGLYRFLSQEGFIDSDPARSVLRPKVPASLPKALTEQEIDQLFAVVGAQDAIARRDRAMLEILYGSGLRISELVGLSLQDLNTEDWTARVLGKGSKERIVPFGSMAVEATQQWLCGSGRGCLQPKQWARRSDSEALFLNARGRRLTRQGAWGILKAHAYRAGLGAKMSPHVLRHSCATHMVEHGADLRVVQELLGHASIGTTQVYTKVTVKQLLEVYSWAHPRARGQGS